MKAIIKFDWKSVVVDINSAAAFLKSLEHAETYDTTHKDGGTIHHVGGEPPSITIRLLSDEEYATGKVAGEKPRN